jgi:hypothetical protein
MGELAVAVPFGRDSYSLLTLLALNQLEEAWTVKDLTDDIRIYEHLPSSPLPLTRL